MTSVRGITVLVAILSGLHFFNSNDGWLTGLETIYQRPVQAKYARKLCKRLEGLPEAEKLLGFLKAACVAPAVSKSG